MQEAQEEEMLLTKKSPRRPRKIAIIEELDQDGGEANEEDGHSHHAVKSFSHPPQIE